jgi:hypothetical protein
LHADCDPEQQLDELCLYKPVEPKSVALPHAIANPRTVVVVSCHTMIAIFAVLGPQWLLDVANRAVLVLNEENDLLLIFTLWLCVFQLHLYLLFNAGFVQGLFHHLGNLIHLLLLPHFATVRDVELDVQRAVHILVVYALRCLKVVHLLDLGAWIVLTFLYWLRLRPEVVNYLLLPTVRFRVI